MSVMTPKQRIRIFEITHDEEILQKMYAQVIKARIYYQSLKF